LFEKQAKKEEAALAASSFQPLATLAQPVAGR
jgi:hypothetical protein